MGFQASVGEGTPPASMLVEACVRSAVQMYNHGPSVFLSGMLDGYGNYRSPTRTLLVPLNP